MSNSSHGLEEWNRWRPSWKTLDGYPSSRHTTKKELAWEFLRRNLDYQEAFDHWKSRRTSNHHGDFVIGLMDLEPRDGHEFRQALNRFYLGNLLIDPQQNSPLRVFQSMRVAFRDYSDNDSCRVSITDDKDVEWVSNFPPTMPEHPWEIVCKFDLRRTIADQIDNAATYLRECQKDAEKRGEFEIFSKSKQSKQVLVRYLRVLDGDFSQAMPSEMATSLFPNIANRFPYFNGSKEVKKQLKAAKDIVRGGYLYLTFDGG